MLIQNSLDPILNATEQRSYDFEKAEKALAKYPKFNQHKFLKKKGRGISIKDDNLKTALQDPEFIEKQMKNLNASKTLWKREDANE